MKSTVIAVGVVALSLVAGAMPTKKELRDVQKLVGELMSSDIQAYRAGKMKASEVAAKAETYARDAETEAAKFLFLKGSFGYYMQGEEYAEALRVLDLLTTSVKDVPDKVLAEIVVAKLKKLSKNKGTAVFEYYERLNQRMSMAEERAKLEKALKENPKSKEARRDLAVCLAVLGDWKGALAHFAEVGGKEAEAVQLELAGKRAPAADAWWDAAQGEAQDALRAHAAGLYRQAITDGKVKGLKLTLAQKRIAEVTPAAEVAASGRSARRADPTDARPASEGNADTVARSDAVGPARRAGRSDAARPNAAAAPNARYDWSIPKNLKGVRTLDFDLGCPEKITFFAIPSGEDEMFIGKGKPQRFRVTRPFWVAQFNLTWKQIRACGVEPSWPRVDRIERLVEACEGDPKVLVQPGVFMHEGDQVFQNLNERFGHLLPKGMVFRPLTCAESKVVEKSEFHAEKPIPDQIFQALKAKGFYADCKNSREMVEAFRHGRGPFPPGVLLPAADRIRALRRIAWIYDSSFVFNPSLDRISTPGFTHTWGWQDGLIEKVGKQFLKEDWRDVNPFWYCEEDAVCQRSVVTFDLWNLRTHDRPYYAVRVAVGFDYVGEWKRAHAK